MFSLITVISYLLLLVLVFTSVLEIKHGGSLHFVRVVNNKGNEMTVGVSVLLYVLLWAITNGLSIAANVAIVEVIIFICSIFKKSQGKSEFDLIFTPVVNFSVIVAYPITILLTLLAMFHVITISFKVP